jgi:hypothetical protein
MTYEQMKDLKPGNFKRACGVHPQTFETMVDQRGMPPLVH